MRQIHINEIEPSYQPREQILSQLSGYPGEPEMSAFESGFLCGLLKKCRPRKILEVGVAAGGTTAIILQCLDNIGDSNVEMYSVDYLTYFHRDAKKISGFLGEEAKEILNSSKVKHTFLRGGIACSFMEQIGGDIDFLILDTMHSLPGEVLDFLTLLPYLKDGAMVVIHDISLWTWGIEHRNSYATTALLAGVVADKYYNTDRGQYPNIGAFVVGRETREHASNLFLTLTLPWGYMPREGQLTAYQAELEKHYDTAWIEIIHQAKWCNRNAGKGSYYFPKHMVRPNDRVVLYGAGVAGNELYMQNKEGKYCKIVQWVDQKFSVIDSYKGIVRTKPEQIGQYQYDYVLIAVKGKEVAEHIRSNLLRLGVPAEKILWSDYTKEG